MKRPKSTAKDASTNSLLGLGQRVRDARVERGLSLAELAKSLGVSKGYLSRVESGKTKPAVQMIEQCAQIMGLDSEPLLMLAGHLPSEVQRILYQHPEQATAILRETFGKHEGDIQSPRQLALLGSPAAENGKKHGHYQLVHGNCFEWLSLREAHSIHAIVTDPPYGLKEYTLVEKSKLRAGRGGVWRIPPRLDGYERSPLPRFTVLTYEDREGLREFFAEWAAKAFRVLVPGGHVFIATNSLVSHLVYLALENAGFEKRGEIIRLVQTLRGGDRPKNAHEEFKDVTVMPRSAWEPWGLFRKPCEGRVQDNLRRWKTGGLRRISAERPFCDVIKSAPTRANEREIAPHPSLKPQAFMRQIVRAALPLGEGVLLDPFMGAGSTIAAACAVGYQSIGIELDDEYYNMAVDAIPRLCAHITNGLSSESSWEQL